MFGFKKQNSASAKLNEEAPMSASNLTNTLLVTQPQANVVENPFRYSVIYIVEHSEEGAFGVNLSNASHNQLKDMPIEQEQTIPDWLSNRNLLKGGPVELEKVWILEPKKQQHDLSHFKNDNCGLSFYRETLNRVLQQEIPIDVQIGIGTCGWGKGQLEDEINRNHWLVLPSIKELVFNNSWPLLYLNAYDVYVNLFAKR